MVQGESTTRVREAISTTRDRLPGEESFSSPLHTTRVAAILGIALGIAFTICFLTGLISHVHQHPLSWLEIPLEAAGFFRVTQSMHVVTGIAAVPLLLAKLWTVYPLFWKRPAVAGVAHALERLSLFPLVAGSLFMLFTGVINIAYWYTPMGFFFTSGHFWAAWITIGALVIHIGAKVSITRLALSHRAPDRIEVDGPGLSRRGLLATVTATAGVLTVATIGQTVGVFRRISVLAPRIPNEGPQGYPINKSFADSGIDPNTVADTAYVLTVRGEVSEELSFTLADLQSMPQHEAVLAIQCVEGWSYSATWQGVRVRDLLDRAGASADAEVRVESLQTGSIYAMSPLNPRQARDADTVLALRLDGQPLAADHGYPLRLMSPNRPGVQQTKWVTNLEVW